MSVVADTKQLTRFLTFQRKQIPFATMMALNDVAFDARLSVQKSLPKRLDRPTPAIIKSVQVEKAKKKILIATVGFAGLGFKSSKWKESSAEIMRRHIEGGTRSAKGTHLRIPSDTKGGGIKLNKYGNIGGKKAKVAKMIGNNDQFFEGIPKGDFGANDRGIWERTPRNSKRKSNKKHVASGKIVQRIAYEPYADYSPRYPFEKIVKLAVNKNYKKRFEAAINKALKDPK